MIASARGRAERSGNVRERRMSEDEARGKEDEGKAEGGAALGT